MNKKAIHSELDIKGAVYLAHLIKIKHLEKKRVLESKDYLDLELKFEDWNSHNEEEIVDVSKSSFMRLLSLIGKPHAILFDTLDRIVKWFFDDVKTSFESFLSENVSEINDSELVTRDEIERILIGLNGKQVSIPEQAILNLNEGISINLGKGFIKKLIQEVSIFTGKLIEEKWRKKPKAIGRNLDDRVSYRIQIQENRRQKNIDSIVIKAINFAREKESSSDSPDPDWIIEFFNLAQDCSDENMQYLWAKLLADEVDQPYSFSRRTLGIVKLLSAIEAQIFSKLCGCIWDYKDPRNWKKKMLITDLDTDGIFSEKTWGFDSVYIEHLEELGLISSSFLELEDNDFYKMSFFGKTHVLKVSEKLPQIDVIALTKVGEEIFKIVRPIPNQEYYEHTFKFFKKSDILKE